MPAPPPPPGPPPPPSGPPPPPSMGALRPSKGASTGDGRNMLLQSIRQGAKLKKTVTVDKSAPMIARKTPVAAPPVGNGVGPRGPAPAVNGSPVGLGGLFAGGMPKLRSTNKGFGGAQSSGTTKSASPPQPPKASSQTLPRRFNESPEKVRASPFQQSNSSKSPSPQFEGIKSPGQASISQLSQALGQALAGRSAEAPKSQEVRNRAPPPQPPPPNKPNLSLSSVDSVSSQQSALHRLHSRTEPPQPANPPSPNISSLHANKSVLHSTASWNQGGGGLMSPPTPTALHHSATDLTDSSMPGKVGFGKPNVAPKPPGMVPSPNGQINNSKTLSPKKLNINGNQPLRSASVRVPRSPSVTRPCPPDLPNNGFGHLKGSAFHQSQDSIDRKPLPTLGKNFAPQPPIGPRIGVRGPVRPPNQCPPPPPTRPNNLPPPPPPPPHRQNSTQITSQHMRSNSTPNTGPPQLPVRNSSELDSRFADKFRTPAQFPFPDAFLRIEKTYSSANSANANVNKQQAPMPPTTHFNSKVWGSNLSNC